MAPLDPRYLAQLAPGRLIQHDEFCTRCRYNLRGLRTNQRCPECGTPIDFERAWREAPADYGPPVVYKDPGPFFAAPPAYIRWLARAFTVLAWSAGVMYLGFVTLLAMPHAVAGAAPLGAAAFWVWACLVVTMRRRVSKPKNIDTRREWSRLRSAVRWTQPLWAGVALAGVALAWPGLVPAASCPSPPERRAVLGAGLAAGGLAGAGATALWVLLSNLAFWIGDSALASRFREAAWVQAGAVAVGVPAMATGALPALLRGTLDWRDLGQVLPAVLALASIAAVLFPVWCLWRLARTAALIRRHLSEGGALPPARGARG